MFSYWEKTYFLNEPDVCIVGAGIVGLSTALFIKEKHPDYKVFVLERGFLPDGASTKNAGFCCFGSASELADDCAKWPKEQVLALAQKRFEGLQLLKQIVGEGTMEYEQLGGYEVFTSDSDFERYFSFAQELNKDFVSSIGSDVYTDSSKEIKVFGFHGVAGMIKNNFEGQINTGKMAQALLEKVKDVGIQVFFGLELDKFEDNKTNVVLHTKFGVIQTRKLFITTNGFAKQLLPELDVQPARAQVLITKPVNNLKFKGSFHYEQGYYYFRNVGNRVLFGGGRNLDFSTENTYEKGLTALVQNRLEDILSNVILPQTKFEVDMRWSGTMGVGSEKKTIVRNISDNVVCGVRMGGMGVALGSLVGKELSEMI